MHSIFALAAAIVAIFAITLLVPAVAAWAYADWGALEALLLTSVAYGFLASATIMTLMPRVRRLNRAGVFYATIAMWLALSLSATTPFVLIENLPPAQAIFEAVSATITLGTTFRDAADISPTMALYRGCVAWQGGLLTLLIAVYVLGRYQVGGTPNRHLRYILHSFQSGDPRIVQTFFEVFVPYLAVTLVCAAALVITRTKPMDAFNISLNIVSTNGFLPLQTGASLLNNTAGEIVLMVFMLLSATSIVWHRALINRRWRLVGEQPEISMFLTSVFAISAIAAIVAVVRTDGNFSPDSAILNATFDVVSVMTTTGIVHDQRFGMGLPFELILAAALIGGCSYSTAGGLKVFRLQAMLHHSANEVRKLVFPHLVLANSVDDTAELKLAKAIWSAFYVAILTIVCSTLVFAFQGMDLTSSLGLSVGSFSSTASLVQTSSGNDPTNGIMLTIAATGLIARIELLVALAALQRSV